MKEIERSAIAKNNVRFLVIPAKAGIQNLGPGSKPAPDHDPGSGVTGAVPVKWTRISASSIDIRLLIVSFVFRFSTLQES